MGRDPGDLVVRVAEAADTAGIAFLRALWRPAAADDPGFEERVATWLALEGDRRTTWLATLAGSPVGMASLLEYRRMPRPGLPDSQWGYLGNMFVRTEFRNRGIGSALLTMIIEVADRRGYVRVVLAPSERALPFFRRAGFIVADERAGGDLLLMRPLGTRSTATSTPSR